MYDHGNKREEKLNIDMEASKTIGFRLAEDGDTCTEVEARMVKGN